MAVEHHPPVAMTTVGRHRTDGDVDGTIAVMAEDFPRLRGRRLGDHVPKERPYDGARRYLPNCRSGDAPPKTP